ncbi:MAG: hypothetical protein ACYDG2_23360 [Ruminiclostridium sp.]
MISVGIDVSKEKSTVCILKPYGDIVNKPFEINHVEKELAGLATILLRFDDEVLTFLSRFLWSIILKHLVE